MKRICSLAVAFATFAGLATAQTMRVHEGSVTTAVTATADEMTFVGGEAVSIGGKLFAVSDIDSVVIAEGTVVDNTISVTYSGQTAAVVVSGNVAPYVTVAVSGADVRIVQSADLAEEITYTLQGESDNGSFFMDGELKASVVLNGLTLNSTSGAAIDIENGKRISVELADGTVTTLTDAAGGSQKGCFMVNGHTEFKGGGTLCLTGNAKHAFFGDEYVELKKSTGTIIVNGAKKDGFNINQYLEVKGGTINVSGVGDDCMQVSLTDDDTDEQNGQVIISGGVLTLNTAATAAKGIKCDDALTVNGGTINITTTGDGEFDSDDNDASGCAAMKADGVITIADGTLTLKSTGSGGKGISSDMDIVINGGKIDITTTGKKYVYGQYDTSPKGIKADGNLIVNGGEITVSATGGEGSEGMESKDSLIVNGGKIVVNTYDDAFNASNNITITGGYVYANATGNDGMDSNGTLDISGGVVIAIGTNSPEEGFDCDNNRFAVTGGTLIGIGGSTSTPTVSATTQPVMVVGGTSFSANQYVALGDAGGNNIFAFRVPQTYRQATLLVSSPSLVKGSSYTVATGVSVTGGTDWQGYVTDCTTSGGSGSVNVTLNSMVTTSGNAGGGGGPGGGPWFN